MSKIIPRDAYLRRATVVARDLLGMRLVRVLNGQRLSGRIVETEAYSSLDDAASHAYPGRTPRNLPMWETPGHAYVYLTYGIHWLLNIVCEPAGQPAAVLIRAIEPLEGRATIAARRPGRAEHEWTSGPARLTLALGIDQAQNRVDMTGRAAGLWIEYDNPVSDDQVQAGPRIGLGKSVPDRWRAMPWRWWVADNPHVSR